MCDVVAKWVPLVKMLKTKPLRDVDIFFCLGVKDRHWRGKPPNDVLDAFEACLVKKYGTDSVERGRRCVTVEFEKRNPTADEEGQSCMMPSCAAAKKRRTSLAYFVKGGSTRSSAITSISLST